MEQALSAESLGWKSRFQHRQNPVPIPSGQLVFDFFRFSEATQVHPVFERSCTTQNHLAWLAEERGNEPKKLANAKGSRHDRSKPTLVLRFCHHVLDSLWKDRRSFQVEGADQVPEKRGLFLAGLKQNLIQLRIQDLQGKAGKSGSGPDVEQGMTWRRHDRLAADERINKMFDGNLVRVSDRGEVDLAIPCDQFVSIHGQFGNLTGSEPNPEFCGPLE